jgi:hypothetical protein
MGGSVRPSNEMDERSLLALGNPDIVVGSLGRRGGEDGVFYGQSPTSSWVQVRHPFVIGQGYILNGARFDTHRPTPSTLSRARPNLGASPVFFLVQATFLLEESCDHIPFPFPLSR